MTVRQFLCTHTATGEQTVVAMEVPFSGGHNYITASRLAGYYYPADCTVHLLKARAEYRLAFGDLPLIIRRAQRCVP